MAKKNVIDNSVQDLTIDPGAAGDSFIQHDINGIGEFRIGVDDTDDSFRLSQGSALGTNDTFVMTANGERTAPLTPSFLAAMTSTDNNVTGDSTQYDPVCDTEIFDQGGNYNNGTGIFTAPITARYTIFIGISLSGLTAAHNRAVLKFNASNGSFNYMNGNTWAMSNSGSILRMTASILMDMDAADVVFPRVEVSNGALVVDVDGGAVTTMLTWFGGYLAS